MQVEDKGLAKRALESRGLNIHGLENRDKTVLRDEYATNSTVEPIILGDGTSLTITI